MLELAGLVVGLRPGHAQDVGEETLREAVAADEHFSGLFPLAGQDDLFLRAHGDEAGLAETAQHLRDGGGGDTNSSASRAAMTLPPRWFSL